MPFPPRCKAIIKIKGHKLQCSMHEGHDADPEHQPLEASHAFIGTLIWYNDRLQNGKIQFCGFNHNSPYVYGPGNNADRKTFPGDKDASEGFD